MPINSKAKGGAFEREGCKILSKWWSKGESNKILWRSASSGALATLGNDSLYHCGDLTQHPSSIEKYGEFPFCVEFKHIKRFDVLNQSAILEKHIKQLLKECPIDKNPLLVFKTNFSIVRIALSDNTPVKDIIEFPETYVRFIYKEVGYSLLPITWLTNYTPNLFRR